MNFSSDISNINYIIKHQFCLETKNKLTDDNIRDSCLSNPSMITEYNRMDNILKDEGINDEQRNRLISKLIEPKPGLKGKIRGELFNIIVKEKLKNEFNNEIYDLSFEKDCIKQKTDEKPDWFIVNKNTNKYLIGYNQIDLWGGGAQNNRFGKYMKLNNVLCVVVNDVEVKETRKNCKLFIDGITQQRLCWMKGLIRIIHNRIDY